ncbi:MAG: hypothetical protein KC731_42250 [Myxococcales bacterium]|nr:hypothetical protein [Myxococcales bacterium]
MSSPRVNLFRAASIPLMLGLLLGLAACKEDPPPSKPKPDADAGAPAMDPNIAAAVQSVAVAPSPSPSDAQGPPPNGVFGPGEADKAHAPNAPLAVEMVSKGSEPRQKISVNRDLSKGASLTVLVSMALPNGQLPPVGFELKATTPKPEGDELPTGPVPITFAIKDAAAVAAQGVPEPGPEIQKMLGTLKGSKITAQLAPDGSLSGEKIELGEDVKPPIDQFVIGLSNVLSLYFSPMPAEPVGPGATWLAHDRADFAGMKVVRYRATTLQAAEGDQLAFSLDMRMYAIDETQMPSIVQGEAVLMGLATESKGKWVRAVDGLLPLSGQLQVPLVAQLGSPNQPGQTMPVKFQTIVQIGKPGKPSAPAPSGAPPGGTPPGGAPPGAP